ncbi:MAG: Ferric siderophore transport system, periplasmic binding protein TonB [uncultured Sulfurovum sp.]|uniref:Ferric siderophore transport system, periplasmic binding protein TonB n=1 Tax=uncultured Sulfurovum sp. TaxID=269237 RepID=A0A6S6TZN8_9BACT|nr:MAG: Ferric siderophore transport system, periplasmic binding protein TonB [uncultured Sulfurovum sp.]
MRVLKAFVISLLIYALLIWVFFNQLSLIEVPQKRLKNHVVKLDIIHVPPAIKPTPIAKPQPMVKPIIPKTPEVVKKEPVKKKKLVKQKTVKKKPIKKEPPKKKVVIKKKPSDKKVSVPKKVVKEEKVVEKKSEALEQFENEMVYISEPMIASPKKAEKQADDLGSFLATPSAPISPWSYPNNKVRKLYGQEFHNFTPVQKKFIENNLDKIQEITQRTLTRRGYPEGAGQTGQEGTNVVSFNLHSNGDISNLRLKTRIGYRALDDNTLSLIRVAYMDYPYPSTTTKIIFYVTYSIYGY